MVKAADLPISPLAPARFPDLPAVPGVRMASLPAGLRYQGRDDLTLFALADGSRIAGCFTRSKTAAAPVEWCRSLVKKGAGRAILVNAGNANAFTGVKGRRAVELSAQAVAGCVSCAPDEVWLASTGVIGEPLDATDFGGHVAQLCARLEPAAWERAARAIATTDTFAKGAVLRTEIAGQDVTLCGIAKGSGMIAPDMATMLAFVFTDAAIAPGALQSVLAQAVDKSFNRITVDGDTSTSDTVLLAATGAAGNAPVKDASATELAGFRAALTTLTTDLAKQIVRDGEGAQKFITVEVSGAEHDQAARRIAFAIANSPLVKTMVAGEDPNWGRLVMAVGKAGEAADRDRLSVWIGDQQAAKSGALSDSYDEAAARAHLAGREVRLCVDVGVGDASDTVWTCDLTHGYIAINADYRS
ncbi:MAG: bifunctional glutamate N-acetyltransferase/amino-acid acetyltransferase ArgJ [Rhodothalassiaceae bacterium]